MWTRRPFTAPSSSPVKAAAPKIAIQPKGAPIDSPHRTRIDATTYCATVAVAVKEMSIPPEMRTVSNPAAMIPTKA